MNATHLRTDYLENPLGLGDPKPRFSWHAEGGIAQTAYRIICMRGDETVWDSGRVENPSMTHIAYEGEELHSREVVTWSVELWDESGKAGSISTAFFELGLLAPSDWSAAWISGDYDPEAGRRYPADCFRKTFSAAKPIVKARLYATARGIYDATVNGKRVEDFVLAPGVTDYRKRIQVQTYDVTDLLGHENTIELRLADGWFRGSSAAYGVVNVYGNQTALIAQLEIDYADGTGECICTDGTWEWCNDGPIRFADLKDGEIFDARMAPSYNGHAREVAAPQAGLLVCSNNVPVTEHESLSPQLLVAADGTRVLDFGQNIAGYLEFSVTGKRGARMTLTCGEVLDENGHVDLSGIQESRPAAGWTQIGLLKKLLGMPVKGPVDPTPRQQISFTCSGGEDRYKTSFAVFGFRYVQVAGSVDIDPADFIAIAVYSDLEQTGTFACSDERVNKLVENTRWSMKGNFLDVPTDCPTRERLGWTGDAQIFFDTGAYLMDTAPFFAKWLRDMEDAQYDGGLLPAVLPYAGVEQMYKATGSSVGWADAVYLIPYRYWKRFGDEQALRSSWPMIKRYAEHLEKSLEKDGHYEKGVHLGEWLEPEEFRDKVYGAQAKHPEECTAYLYLAMATIAQIADALGEPSDAYRAIAERAKAAYPSYAELETDRQAKLVRPLALGLLDGAAKTAVQARLVKAVENYGYRVGTGFLSTPFVLPVLTEAGRSDVAYRMLLNTEKPGWLAEVLDGATTIWENWEGDLSQNHYSPGAVCQWLFDTCAGIRVAGERHFVIAPMPGEALEHAEASYLSPYGMVRSRWEKADTGIKFKIEVPSNCTAEIVLPDGTGETVYAGVHVYER